MIAPNSAWPPPVLEKVTERTNEAQVWWQGDTAALNEYYQRSDNSSRTGTRSRIRDAFAAFWGRPNLNPKQPLKRLHVPVAGDIVKLSATALFANPWTFSDANDDAAVQARLDEVFNTPTFHAATFAAAESASALGGVFVRVVWDDTVRKNAWLDFVDTDRAIPEYRWGQLVAVTFWSELAGSDDRTVYRHLERHEPGQVVHQLFAGTPHNLGKLLPLEDHPDTEDLAREVNADAAVPTGVDELAAWYVPNVLPNPMWRNHPTLRYLGRADISSDVIPLMDQLDEIYTSLMRDFRVGKARMFASDQVLTNLGAGNGSLFPEDREVFSPVGSAISKDGGMASLFEFHQPDIRVVEHGSGSDMLVREILRRTGYSPMSFGMADEVAQTATEVTGKKELTLTTTEGKARHWSAALGPAVTTCLRIDARLFGQTEPAEQVDVVTPKFATESDLTKAQTVQAWHVAGAASTATKVAFLHEDWDDKQVSDEVKLIEAATSVVSPFDTFGADQNPDPDADVAEDDTEITDDDNTDE